MGMIFFEGYIMSERKFLIEDNQEIWDSYFNQNLQAWEKENRQKLESQEWTEEEKIIKGKRFLDYMYLEKITPYNCAYIKKRQSIQQYKPTILKFEELCKKSFNCVTANDVEQFRNSVLKIDKRNHFNGFMIYCVSNGIIKNENKDFLLSLLPNAYKKIGELLLKES